jgi:hypothetical protein
MREKLLMLHEQATKKAAQLALTRGHDGVGLAAGFLVAATAGFLLARALDHYFDPPQGGTRA